MKKICKICIVVVLFMIITAQIQAMRKLPLQVSKNTAEISRNKFLNLQPISTMLKDQVQDETSDINLRLEFLEQQQVAPLIFKNSIINNNAKSQLVNPFELNYEIIMPQRETNFNLFKNCKFPILENCLQNFKKTIPEENYENSLLQPKYQKEIVCSVLRDVSLVKFVIGYETEHEYIFEINDEKLISFYNFIKSKYHIEIDFKIFYCIFVEKFFEFIE